MIEKPSALSLKEELSQLLDNEKSKSARYKKENARRRHNFVPFVIELLQNLAQKSEILDPALQRAEKKMKTGATKGSG